MLGALAEKPGDGKGHVSPLLLLSGMILGLSIGLRFEVGGDWFTYARMFQILSGRNLEQALASGDPAYQFINWLVQQVGADVWLVNLVCGAIFSWGLVRFASYQSRPMLTLLVALPYLIIVVAMGYTRQATAIGIILAGLASFQNNVSILRFAFYVAVAATFHRTAVVAFPLVALAGQRNGMTNFLIALSVTFLFYSLFLAGDTDKLVSGYVRKGMASGGAGFRVAMSVIPAIIFLCFMKRFAFPPHKNALWRNFALTSLVCLALLFTLPSSTVVDRLALYVIPLQLVVFSGLPNVVMTEAAGKASVIFYAFSVQFVWLTFGTFASYWLPYGSVLFS